MLLYGKAFFSFVLYMKICDYFVFEKNDFFARKVLTIDR